MATWGCLFRDFELEHGFDPRELFPRVRNKDQYEYIRNDFESVAIRDIYRAEDEKILAEINEAIFLIRA